MGNARKAHDSYPLRTVARLTGLTPDLIRAWERRYGVVSPRRGPRGARLYTVEDVAHLRLLARVVAAGRAIGDVARLGRRELESLAGATLRLGADVEAAGDGIVERALAAVQTFDAGALDRRLGEALLALGSGAFIRRVASPLLREVGKRWSEGTFSVADEHLVSGLLHGLLGSLLRLRGQTAQPVALLATPSGERHEFGLMLVALLFVDAGVGVSYLGADLPVGEIVVAVRRSGAMVAGLSVVNGANRRRAAQQVAQLERQLPAITELWLGGRDAGAVAAQAGRTRALVFDETERVEAEIARIRERAAVRA
jgi:DNA-binding transcriptional MerR regulator/methylmalonyl-CoA mutase cobalamin-binding subunit